MHTVHRPICTIVNIFVCELCINYYYYFNGRENLKRMIWMNNWTFLLSFSGSPFSIVGHTNDVKHTKHLYYFQNKKKFAIKKMFVQMINPIQMHIALCTYCWKIKCFLIHFCGNRIPCTPNRNQSNNFI